MDKKGLSAHEIEYQEMTEHLCVKVRNREGKAKYIRQDRVIFDQKCDAKILQDLNAWEEKAPAPEQGKQEGISMPAHKGKKGGKSLNPFTCLRTLVSQEKVRFQADGFNLDLTYITNYCIALGYPADGMESAIRNRRQDVISFLRSRHGNFVKIYNLCIEGSKQYEQDKIPDFGYQKFPFCDHQIASTKLIFNICLDMFLFLQKMNQLKMDLQRCLSRDNKGSELNKEQLKRISDDYTRTPVVAVHCKAGKGRTGLIICCFMLFAGIFTSVKECLHHYDSTRTKNNKALTI